MDAHNPDIRAERINITDNPTLSNSARGYVTFGLIGFRHTISVKDEERTFFTNRKINRGEKSQRQDDTEDKRDERADNWTRHGSLLVNWLGLMNMSIAKGAEYV